MEYLVARISIAIQNTNLNVYLTISVPTYVLESAGVVVYISTVQLIRMPTSFSVNVCYLLYYATKV